MPQTAKRAATRSAAAAQSSARAAKGSGKGSGKVRTFAPLPAGVASAGSAGGHTLEHCPGCAYTPWPQCAACGAPTVYALEVAGVNGAGGAQAHALTLCAACHALLLRLRDPDAEPLQYLPLTRQTKRQRQPAKQQTKQQTKQPARRSSRAQGGAA